MVSVVQMAVLRQALRRVHDPHVPASLESMGMLESMTCGETGDVRVVVRMPCLACPGSGMIIDDVRQALEAVEGVRSVQVELSWSGQWRRELIAPEVRALMRRHNIAT